MVSVINGKDSALNVSRQNQKVFNRSLLASSIAIAIGSGMGIAYAAIEDGAQLSFNPGSPVITSCLIGSFTNGTCTAGSAVGITDMGGSYFKMDQGNGNADKNAISQFAAITLGQIQQSSGQHTGTIDGSESPAVDNPWNFFGNTGMHSLNSPVTVSQDLGTSHIMDFSGWGVNWSEFGPGGSSGPTIPMAPMPLAVPDPSDPKNIDRAATLVCDPTDCSNGASYSMDMAVHVPVAFPSVPYSLHLEGNITLPGSVELKDDDNIVTIVGNPVTIGVLGNDISADADANGTTFDFSTLVVDTPAINGTAVPNANGEIVYTPGAVSGTDTFTYTIDGATGAAPDRSAEVTVDVQTNLAPVVVDDSLTGNTSALALAPITINVLTNDTDSNNESGEIGGIDPSTVTITEQPSVGSCQVDSSGNVSYSQTTPIATGDFTCKYQVSDIDVFAVPLTSNVGNLEITVDEFTSDWPRTPISPDIIPILRFEAGVAALNPDGTRNGVARPSSGSYFTMDVKANSTNYTVLVPGPAGGMIIGHPQPVGFTHTGKPTGFETSSMDQPWLFTSNTGMNYSLGQGVTGNADDGTLNFGTDSAANSGFYISWNYAESAPDTHTIFLGANKLIKDGVRRFPFDEGRAQISCTPAPCADGSTFSMEYRTHVPSGSHGFGSVPYGLFLVGVVDFVDARASSSVGTVMDGAGGFRVDIATLPEDDGVTVSCLGGCYDFTVEGVTTSSVSVVIPLTGGVPVDPDGEVFDPTDPDSVDDDPRWRILENGVWRDFDDSGADSVKSTVPVNGVCPSVGDAAYGSLMANDTCIELTIVDNGPNDKNPAIGTIEDPGGLGAGDGSSGFVDNRTSSTSGCTLKANNLRKPAGTEWWLLGGFIAWLGMRFRKQR